MPKAQSMSSLKKKKKKQLLLGGKIKILLSRLLILLHPYFCSLFNWSSTSLHRYSTSTICCVFTVIWYYFTQLLFTHVHPSFCGSKPRRMTHQQAKVGKKWLKKSDWKISAICTGSIPAISSFPPLGAEESWKIDFTADESGGKAAIASFPPLTPEENWKIHFTADESGGKPAIAGFPPLRVEENWKMRLYRPWKQR